VPSQSKRTATKLSADSTARAEEATRLYEYAACSTCKKARKWLDERGVPYEAIPIATRTPSQTELRRLVKASGLPARKWFNTSGQSYRELVKQRGKEAVEALSEGEITALLAKDGKLIKRPVLVQGDRVLVGFREEDYEAIAR
jgi:arsenate reductase